MRTISAAISFFFTTTVFGSNFSNEYVQVWKDAVALNRPILTALMEQYPKHKKFIEECLAKHAKYLEESEPEYFVRRENNDGSVAYTFFSIAPCEPIDE